MTRSIPHFFRALTLVLWIAWFSGIVAPDVYAGQPTISATVAADGSAQYRTVQEAINAAPQLTRPEDTWTILVKPGVYRELVYVQREKRFIRLVGEDAQSTVIVYNLNANIQGTDGRPIGTFRTPTVWIDADDFAVENLTLFNDAGNVGQALALRVDGDRVTFRRCRFLGWQDTILVNRGRHYFENCTITGAVDFIFGGATSFFQSCELIIEGDGYITAPSTPPTAAYGLVFADCSIRGVNDKVRTYLGRPWRAYGASLFLNTDMTDVVRPVGWHNWGKVERETTSRFIEFNSRGVGNLPEQRVPWAKQLPPTEATNVTPNRVLGGTDGWAPDQR